MSPPPSPPPEPTDLEIAERQLLQLLSDPTTSGLMTKTMAKIARVEGDEGEAAAEVLSSLLADSPTAEMLHWLLSPPDVSLSECEARGWPAKAFDHCCRERCVLSCMRRCARDCPESLDVWAARRVELDELYKAHVESGGFSRRSALSAPRGVAQAMPPHVG